MIIHHLKTRINKKINKIYVILFIFVIFILTFPIFCYSQVTATANVGVTIISIDDTAKYNLENVSDTIISNEIEITVEKGDTKSYLLKTFNPPDEKLILYNDKEVWTYGKLIVYINNNIVEFTRLAK